MSRWAELEPERPAVTFAADAATQSKSYGELVRDARCLAGALLRRGLRGERALIACPLGLDFARAFLACLYAGVVAVPLPFGQGKSLRARLAAVVADARPKAVLAPGGARGLGALHDSDALAGVVHICLDDADTFPASPSAPDVEAGELAFLQYTSGSTSEPKGTAVTHGNILANQRMLAELFGTSRDTVVVSWLPLFHDMGLIGMLLHGLYLGGHVVLLPTLSVLKSPLVWLSAIERYRGTFSAAPNFAYDLCVDKTTPAEREQLDLRSWAVAVNGSEPVRHATVARFERAFASSGLPASALAPAYGLAEATLVVSGSVGRPATFLPVDAAALANDRVLPAPDDEDAHRLVGCGRFDLGDQELRIVDPVHFTRRGDGEVGEIWLAGSHVAAGYFGNRQATAERFGATLPGDAGRYLRTGDLGFLRDGELFVTGRIKDLIIVRGQKFYPQDLEGSAAGASPHVRRGCVAAFGVEDGEPPEIVVVAEVERRELATPELAALVARAVQAQHDLPLSRVELVAKGTVPKTSSGKLQRSRCRRDYLDGRTSVLATWRAQGPSPRAAALEREVERCAREWLAARRALAPASVDVLAPFAELGVDSIVRVELLLAIEQRFGLAVPDSVAHALGSIRELARFVADPDRPAHAPGPAGDRPPAPQSPSASEPVLPDFSALCWDDE